MILLNVIYKNKGEVFVMRGIYFLMLFLMMFSPVSAAAKHKQNEAFYRDQWCADRGQSEFVLPDKTRCDCLTKTHAVEVDFAPKFYEAIGQSLYYSLQTGKRAGVLLIVETPKDYKYWLRLNSVIDHFNLPLDTWLIK